jgi:5-methylcytosine-specific restriction endonuclease McrA
MRIGRRRIDKFYKSRKWAGQRAVAIFHYKPECRFCGTHEEPFEVDHIIPITEWWDGRLLLTNLQILCGPCHQAKHRPNHS